MVDNNIFWGYSDLPPGFKAFVYPLFFYPPFLKKGTLISYISKFNGIKGLAVILRALVRLSSLLADRPPSSPLWLAGECFVASSSGSACLSHL